MKGYKYYAFISYSSHDMEWGKWLQRRLENYRLPAVLCGRYGLARKPIRPVFFAPYDILPGNLHREVREQIGASRHFVVICSPHSAQSEWVGREIEYFHGTGHPDRMHFFIVDGIPYSNNVETECYHPVIKSLGLPEILGANVHERVYRLPWMNRERALVQLVSKMIGVEFDAIWQRRRRRLIRNVILWLLCVVALLVAGLGIWHAARPFDLTVNLREVTVENDSLPPFSNAVVSLSLDDEVRTDTVHNLTDMARFFNIPRHYMGQNAHIGVMCMDFNGVDTEVVLSHNVVINVRRNPSTYGTVRFRVWDVVSESPVAGVKVMVEGREAVSDSLGEVSVSIPLEQQRRSYNVTIGTYGISDTVYMPSGSNDVILVRSDKRRR